MLNFDAPLSFATAIHFDIMNLCAICKKSYFVFCEYIYIICMYICMCNECALVCAPICMTHFQLCPQNNKTSKSTTVRYIHTYINISHSMVSPVYICSLYYSIFIYSPIVVCFAYIHISQCDSSFTLFMRTVLIFGHRGTSEVRKIYKMFKFDSSMI